MITTLEYYAEGQTKIPNVIIGGGDGSLQDNVQNNNTYVTNLIKRYELAFLIKALGITLAKELLATLEEDGTFKTGTDQKWIDLVDGVSDEDWYGLRQQDEKISIVANFVYCNHLFNLSKGNLTQLGTSLDEVEHSKLVSPQYLFIEPWNEMVCQYQNAADRFSYEWAYNTTSDQPAPKYGITLEQFINNHSEDYPTPKFQYFTLRNSMDL